MRHHSLRFRAAVPGTEASTYPCLRGAVHFVGNQALQDHWIHLFNELEHAMFINRRARIRILLFDHIKPRNVLIAMWTHQAPTTLGANHTAVVSRLKSWRVTESRPFIRFDIAGKPVPLYVLATTIAPVDCVSNPSGVSHNAQLDKVLAQPCVRKIVISSEYMFGNFPWRTGKGGHKNAIVEYALYFSLVVVLKSNSQTLTSAVGLN